MSGDAILIQNSSYWNVIVFRDIYAMIVGWVFFLIGMVGSLLDLSISSEILYFIIVYSLSAIFWTAIMLYGLRHYHFCDRFPKKRIFFMILPPAIWFEILFQLYT